jgi:hypothetical protein
MRDGARPWQTFIPVKIPFFRVGPLDESRGPDIQRGTIPDSERDHNQLRRARQVSCSAVSGKDGAFFPVAVECADLPRSSAT